MYFLFSLSVFGHSYFSLCSWTCSWCPGIYILWNGMCAWILLLSLVQDENIVFLPLGPSLVSLQYVGNGCTINIHAVFHGGKKQVESSKGGLYYCWVRPNKQEAQSYLYKSVSYGHGHITTTNLNACYVRCCDVVHLICRQRTKAIQLLHLHYSTKQGDQERQILYEEDKLQLWSGIPAYI